MSRDHALIVDEMLAEYRARPDTVSVALFGSMARGTVSATSDIDMEVVSRDAPTWTLTKLQKGRIDVDLVICPYEQFSLQVSKYPFLRYDYLSYKVLYDPTQALRDAIAQLKEYYEAHPEIVAYWEANLREMKERKRQGVHRMIDIIEAYDEAERRFSSEGVVSRTFFRAENED